MGPPAQPADRLLEEEFKLELLDLYVTERDALDLHERLLRRVDDATLRPALLACRDQHAEHVHDLKRLLEDRGVEPPEGGGATGAERFARDAVESARTPTDLWSAYEANEARLRRHYNALLLDPELPEDLRPVLERNAFDEAGHEEFAEDVVSAAQASGEA